MNGITKPISILVFLVLALFSVGFSKVSAQTLPTESNLYGTWYYDEYIAPGIIGSGTLYISFHPGSLFVALPYEGIHVGRFTLEGETLTLDGTTYYAQQTPYHQTYRAYMNGETLVLTAPNGYTLPLSRMGGVYARRDCTGGNLPNQLRVGQFGNVTYTDGTPTRMRTHPTTTSDIVDSMQEGTSFAVIDGPVCADGYTWWQVHTIVDHRIGWAAEGRDYYFIEPNFGYSQLPTTIAGIEEPPPVASIQCPTWPTNLYIGALGKVANFGPLTLLPAHAQPSQNADYLGNYPPGMTLIIRDGPVCAEGAIWWAVEPLWEHPGFLGVGWTLETILGNRYILRTTSIPNDPYAVFDPFLASTSVEVMIEAQVPMWVFVQANGDSAKRELIMPGTAYEVIGQTPGGNMFQIITSHGPGWVCAHSYYLRQSDYSHRVPITNSSDFECDYSHLDADPDTALISMGVQVYPPGTYPGIENLERSLNDANVMGAVVDISDITVYLIEGKPNLANIACFGLDALEYANATSGGFVPGPSNQTKVICLLVDMVGTALAVDPTIGTILIVMEIAANPDIYIDPWLDDLNAWVDTMPLTRAYCYFHQELCYPDR